MTSKSSNALIQTRLRVLIVEDQNDLAENLFEFLGDEHYSLDYAADGLTALHLLATQNYDVIVRDLSSYPPGPAMPKTGHSDDRTQRDQR